MDPETLNLPLMGRDASVRVGVTGAATRTIDVTWTTGARVLRRRWEGWDDVVEYEEELEVSPRAIRLDRLNTVGVFLDSHRSWGLEAVIGSVEPGSVRIENGKGSATIRLTGAAGAQDVVERILDGTVRSVSVGYRVHKYEIEKRDGQREIWRAVDWEPYEISAVAIPADAGAQVRGAETRPDLIAPCVIAGDVRHAHPAAPAAILKGQRMEREEQTAAVETRSAESAAPPPAVGAADAAEIRAAEQRRASEILGLCQRHGLAELAAGMIERGIDLDAARAEILDKLVDGHRAAPSAEPAPAQARSAADTGFRDAMTAAILHRLNPGANASTPAAREFLGRRMFELARIALERSGVSTAGMAPMELAGQALGMRAGVGYHATGDFPAILSGVVNKSLRAAYDSTPRTFTGWARQATLSDFRQVERIQLGGAPDLVRVPEGGEFAYGTVGEGKEVYSLSTYGRIIAFTRQALINDDLSAFDRIPRAFGASAADLESDIVYAILVANAAMSDGTALFHANHGNLGTAADVTETSLSEAYRAFAAQRGLEGRPISIQPRFILVPPGRRSVAARKQVASVTPGSTAEVNAFAGRLEVIEEARLIPAAGNDPWFLAADPARIDTVEYAYLEGQQGIFTETRLGFEVDGLEVKARHDFAAKAIDWRGLFKNAGIAPT